MTCYARNLSCEKYPNREISFAIEPLVIEYVVDFETFANKTDLLLSGMNTQSAQIFFDEKTLLSDGLNIYYLDLLIFSFL